MKKHMTAAGLLSAILCSVLCICSCGDTEPAQMASAPNAPDNTTASASDCPGNTTASASDCLDNTTASAPNCLDNTTASAPDYPDNTAASAPDYPDDWFHSLPEMTAGTLTAQAVRGIKLVKNGETLFAISYEPSVYKTTYENWDISVPYESLATVDTEYLYSWLEQVEKLDRVGEETHLSPSEAGFDTKTSTYLSAACYREQIEGIPGEAAPDGQIIYRIGAKDQNGCYYIQKGQNGSVWKVPAEVVDAVYAINPFDAILKVSCSVSLDTVSKITFLQDNRRIEILQEHSALTANGNAIPQEEVSILYAGLLGIYIEQELPETENEYPAETVLTVHLERNTADAPDIILSYFTYDEKYDMVSVNGKNFFLVSKEAVEDYLKLLKSYW